MAIDCDVAAVAQLLVARHGSRARVYASLRVGKLHAPGDASVRQLWMEVVRAIELLLAVLSAIGPGGDYTMLDGRPVF